MSAVSQVIHLGLVTGLNSQFCLRFELFLLCTLSCVIQYLMEYEKEYLHPCELCQGDS